MNTERFWEWLDRRMIVRRVCLGIAVWLTIDSYFWVQGYAMSAGSNQWIVAAVQGIPATMLATMVKFYNEGRK